MHDKPPSSLDILLSVLYQGERVQISFLSASQRETFRKRLYERKLQQDEAIVVLLEEDRKALRCQFLQGKTEEGETAYEMIIWLETKDTKKISWKVLSKEEPSE